MHSRRERARRNRLIYKRTEIQKEEGSKKWYLYLLSLILFGGIIYGFFFSGFFGIKNISVEGTTTQKASEVKDLISAATKGIFNNNIFFFSEEDAKKSVREKIVFQKITVRKKYPSGVMVLVEEYQPAIQWKSNNKYYILDGRGKIIEESDSQKEKLPVVIEEKNLELSVGKTLATEDFINFIKYFNDNFFVVTGKSIEQILINESINEVKIITATNSKFYILVDPGRNPEKELKNIKTVLDSVTKPDLAYIDMRIEGKAFYK